MQVKGKSFLLIWAGYRQGRYEGNLSLPSTQAENRGIFDSQASLDNPITRICSRRELSIIITGDNWVTPVACVCHVKPGLCYVFFFVRNSSFKVCNKFLIVLPHWWQSSMGVDHVNILFLASVEQWSVTIWTYYDIMTIVHLANTIMSGSVSSFRCELFHMFADLRIRLGKCNENRRKFSGELWRNVLL